MNTCACQKSRAITPRPASIVGGTASSASNPVLRTMHQPYSSRSVDRSAAQPTRHEEQLAAGGTTRSRHRSTPPYRQLLDHKRHTGSHERQEQLACCTITRPEQGYSVARHHPIHLAAGATERREQEVSDGQPYGQRHKRCHCPRAATRHLTCGSRRVGAPQVVRSHCWRSQKTERCTPKSVDGSVHPPSPLPRC